jgi:hypothetical protein
MINQPFLRKNNCFLLADLTQESHLSSIKYLTIVKRQQRKRLHEWQRAQEQQNSCIFIILIINNALLLMHQAMALPR